VFKLYHDFPDWEIMPKTKFEAVFRGFVEDFGGEIVPGEAEDGQPSADYFSRQHNIVAELKCFVVGGRAAQIAVYVKLQFGLAAPGITPTFFWPGWGDAGSRNIQ
jgi:hypothetical protein